MLNLMLVLIQSAVWIAGQIDMSQHGSNNL